MAGPELRKPSEELLMLRPSLQSELAALSHRYGIDLKPVEAGQLVDRELPKLKASTPPEIRERMEKALLDYMKTANPSRATTLYNQMQGAKFWDALDIENATIMLGIHKTTVKSALDSCAALPAAQKQAMLESVIAAIAESYRIRGEDHVNEFGVRYDANSSDPSRVISEHTFNCISGSISLGQIVSYAAGRVGLPSCVKPYLQTVASFTKNGVRWEDAGHAILRLDFLDPAGKTTKTVYYDAANDLVPMQHDAFKYNAKDNTLGPADALAGPVEYRLGTVIPIGQILDGEAATQDRLLGGNMGADAIEKMYKLPPVFISYLAANLSKERQAEFFMNYSFETMQSLQQPAMRFRIAAMAAGALAGEDEKKSLACAALAIKSLSEAYSSKATYHQLPMGGFLQTTMDLIAVLKTAPRGDEIIASSPLFAYVPYIASTVAFPDPKLAPVAAKARDFLVELYESNQEDMARLAKSTPSTAILYCQGLVSLNYWAGSTAASRKALDSIYSRVGMKRDEALTLLKSNVRNLSPEGEADAILKSSRSGFILERSLLFIAERFFNGTFDIKVLGQETTMARGPDLVNANAVFTLFSDQLQLASIIVPGGLFFAAVKRARDAHHV